jgi:hypothetical protein
MVYEHHATGIWRAPESPRETQGKDVRLTIPVRIFLVPRGSPSPKKWNVRHGLDESSREGHIFTGLLG